MLEIFGVGVVVVLSAAADTHTLSHTRGRHLQLGRPAVSRGIAAERWWQRVDFGVVGVRGSDVGHWQCQEARCEGHRQDLEAEMVRAS